MKRTVLFGALAASLLLVAAVSSASAASDFTATAKIPFNFSVGAVSMPAGEYTLFEYASGLMRIQGTGPNQCLNLTSPGTSPRNDPSVRLVFHRYEDQYFLSEVFNGEENASRRFPVSKQEKERMSAQSRSVAENSRHPEVVIVAALLTR